MDNTPEVTLARASEKGEVLSIRCMRRRTEVVVATNEITDNGRVRIKLDDGPPQPQAWSEATDNQGLFAPNPVELARELANAKTFLIEYHAFQRAPVTIDFDVAGLSDYIGKVSEACGWEQRDQAQAKAHAAQVAAANLKTKKDQLLRERLSKYVEPCHEDFLRAKGKWCFYDMSDNFFKNGGSPMDTREAALDGALELAKSGRVFAHEMMEIENELK